MELRKIAVIGAGTMGQGIAVMLASKGLDVLLYDKTPELLGQSVEAIEAHLDRQMERWALTRQEKKLILSRLHKVTDMEALAECQLAIESVTEHFETKQRLFIELDRILPPDAILATNTATLSLTLLASRLVYPDRTIGMHFLHPAGQIRMVELVRGMNTSEETFTRMRRFAEQVLDKESVQVYESPGYVTTRLICVLINEAIHALLEGVASAEDIDKAMKLGYDFHYGPLEMADRFGLDSVLASMEALFLEFGDVKFRPNTLLKKTVRSGRLGVKTGRGFFQYTDGGERI
ncbi:3-hydroxyacyl-CoA dehydrogenase NAD-binding domain-containing protein [Paenibacillus doosanensis]|uniref:3-hydroxyacyl-CoA dehydrogenase family protein n=1 Tax=Paenibacillus doosanensis TaxID=1229154 RepID=UPI00217F58D3|nr:3-hydroxyacyl-CoA dehydrogenase NAD-binding domain-containing protein [Paenibacillus doosanensis]MCS7460943.1 3-hydroxyacyl-CoA dehydrogenase NAD-binding domain-containing protein [Paenibacillus doosanensis]